MGRQRQRKRGAPGVTHLRTDPDGVDVWRVRVFGTKDPKTGKVRADMQRRVRGTLAEAVAEREEFRRELEESDSLTGLPPTFGDCAASWLERKLAKGLRASSIASYERRIGWACETLGDFIVDRIMPVDVERMMNHLAGRGLGPRSVNMALQVVLAVVGRWYADRGQLSPLRLVEGMKVPRRTRKATMTAAEVQRMLELARTRTRSPYLYPLLLVMFSTGCRVGEAIALRWSDIDEDKGVIHIRRTSNDRTINPTKSGYDRSPPLHPVVRDALRAWRRQMMVEQKPGLRAGLVFPGTVTRTERPMVQNSVRRHLALLASKLEMEHVVPHDTRRTHIDAARRASVDRALVGDMVGHQSVEQTLDYETVAHEEREAAINAVMVQFGLEGRDGHKDETGHETGHEGIEGDAAVGPRRYNDDENGG